MKLLKSTRLPPILIVIQLAQAVDLHGLSGVPGEALNFEQVLMVINVDIGRFRLDPHPAVIGCQQLNGSSRSGECTCHS